MESAIQSLDMENPFYSPSKAPSAPGTPLQQLSLDRLNQRIPQSPSLPVALDQSGRKSQHRLSDASEVKARIAYLNSMSQNGSPVRSNSPSKSHAAIQRAIVGREEAETALNHITAQLESAKARERLVSERVESLMEQLQDARNRQRHERQVYEKEMRGAKKNEYKAELAVIKLQEELKECKNDLEGYRARADHDKNEKEKARQEAFERAYAVAGLTEELQTLQETLKVVEQERDHAVATAASRMPVEPSVETLSTGVQTDVVQSESANSKRKRPSPAYELGQPQGLIDDMDLEDENCSIEVRYAALQRHAKYLRQQVQEGLENIHFMNMQCQFMACPCRTAERDGVRFVHDYEYDRKVRAQNAKKRKIEDDKPVAKYVPWSAKWSVKKGKEMITRARQPFQHDPEPVEAMEVDQEEQAAAEQLIAETEAAAAETVEAPAAPLPPTHVLADDSQESEQIIEAEEAAQIPLPPTGEDTAQLEDFTQVIVEPAASSQPFSFSTSINNARQCLDSAPEIQSAQGEVTMSDELFNLSPPKRMPPRPSTAMGVLTIDSPIRLVPESPQPASAHAMRSYAETRSRPTRVALNDASPEKTQPGPRPQSRSRGRSPAVLSTQDLRPESAMSILEAQSPASSTVSPFSPVPKQRRPEAQDVAQPNAQSRSSHGDSTRRNQHQSHHILSETTTTTTIPLRADDESDATELTSQASTMSAAESGSASVFLKDTFNVPGTPITREAALAQIRARRDRARSVNMRKSADTQHPDGGDRTAVSKGSRTPGSVARRGVKIDLSTRLGLNGNDRERGRDVSHASAPGGF